MKSTYDEYLRDHVLFLPNAIQHPVAWELMTGKLVRAIRRRQSKVGLAAAAGAIRSHYTPAGIYRGEEPMMEVDGERVDNALRFIVHGLYCHTTKLRLGHHHDIEVFWVETPYDGEIVRDFSRLASGPRIVLGEEVFWSPPALYPEEPSKSAWLLCFYDRVLFAAYTRQVPHSDLLDVVTPHTPRHVPVSDN